MRGWFEKAVEELEAELDRGALTQAEFRAEMRSLRAELQDEAYEAAEQGYMDVMGYY